MKHLKQLLATLLALALILALCACGPTNQTTGGDPSSQPTGTSDPAASGDPDPEPTIEVDLAQDILAFSAGLSVEDKLLQINGEAIPTDLVLYWLGLNCDRLMQYYSIYGYTLADNAQLLLDDTVDLCSYYTILHQKAAELGCLLTDAQVQDAKDQMLADGQEQYDLRKAMFGLTDSTMEYIYTMQAYHDNLIGALVPTVTDEMLNGYAYHVKHILLLTVDMNAQPELQEDGSYAYPSLDEETVAAKKAQIDDMLAQLRASDDPEALFDQLMNEFSEDSGLQSNPDGYTATPGQMVPVFEETAFSLEFGEISEVVKSTYGYHIILRGEVEDLESYSDDYREYVLDQELTALMDGAEVVREPALDAIDVESFYNRYVAYQQAMLAAQEGDGGNG